MSSTRQGSSALLAEVKRQKHERKEAAGNIQEGLTSIGRGIKGLFGKPKNRIEEDQLDPLPGKTLKKSKSPSFWSTCCCAADTEKSEEGPLIKNNVKYYR